MASLPNDNRPMSLKPPLGRRGSLGAGGFAFDFVGFCFFIPYTYAENREIHFMYVIDREGPTE